MKYFSAWVSEPKRLGAWVHNMMRFSRPSVKPARSEQMRKRLTIGASILFLATPMGFANALDQRLVGAWVQSAAECNEVFETRDGAVGFRQPVNTFVSAFIVRGQDVQAVNGSCRINDASSAANGYLRLKLECKDSISFLPLDARVKILGGTQLSYGDFSSDPTIDATFKRCAP